MAGECLAPRMRELHLAGRGRRLQIFEPRSPCIDVQDAAPQSDGAGGHDNDVAAGRMQASNVDRQRIQPHAIQFAAGIDQQ